MTGLTELQEDNRQLWGQRNHCVLDENPNENPENFLPGL